MSMPGWYPDPEGVPYRLRYWDGNMWTGSVSEPVAATRDGSSNTPWIVLSIVGVLLVAVLAYVWFSRDRSAQPPEGSESQTTSVRETVPPPVPITLTAPPPPSSEPVSTTPTGVRQVETCTRTGVAGTSPEPRDGRIHSGGISFEVPVGWFPNGFIDDEWASDRVELIPPYNHRWDWLSVAQLNHKDGFIDPMASVAVVMECVIASHHSGASFVERTDLVNEQVTIDGHPAEHMRTQLHTGEGEYRPELHMILDVYVIDYGDPERMGQFIATYEEGNPAQQAIAETATASLRVG